MVRIIPQTVPICESLEVFSGVHPDTTDQHKDLRPTSTARDGIHYTRFKDYLAQHSPFIYTSNIIMHLYISSGFYTFQTVILAAIYDLYIIHSSYFISDFGEGKNDRPLYVRCHN